MFFSTQEAHNSPTPSAEDPMPSSASMRTCIFNQHIYTKIYTHEIIIIITIINQGWKRRLRIEHSGRACGKVQLQLPAPQNKMTGIDKYGIGLTLLYINPVDSVSYAT